MANKKINQLVSKTTILSTDLFGIGDSTTGQLYKKTIAELQAAIGGAVISVNGLIGTVVLNTDNIQETGTPTNKYFTDARARNAISLTTTGNSGASTYSNSTGVLNIPTYTLTGLGGISLTSLSGGTGITYNNTTGAISYSGTVYTDASVRALLSGDTGITYNSTTGAISYSGTVYTNASIRSLISSGAGISYNSTTGVIDSLLSLTTTGNSGASTYNSTTGVLNIPQYQSVLTNPITGTGTINYVPKFTSSSALGNSIIQDSGTLVTISGSNNILSLNNGTATTGIYQTYINNAGTAGIGVDNISGTLGGSPYCLFIKSAPGRLVYISSGSTNNNLILNETGNVTTAKDIIVGGSGSGVYLSIYNVGNRQALLSRLSTSWLDVANSADWTGVTLVASGGNCLIGTQTNNGERLYVSGTIRATGTITANSDISLKKNLLKIENAIQKVEQINGYTYELKEGNSKRYAGVIAQEIQEVLPEIVNKGNDGIYGVEYGNISALLIEAIKEQQIQINELKALLNK
jgi:hypothetical protein